MTSNPLFKKSFGVYKNEVRNSRQNDEGSLQEKKDLNLGLDSKRWQRFFLKVNLEKDMVLSVQNRSLGRGKLHHSL